MTYVLALDQGTTGSTAILFDLEGRPVAKGYQEFPQYFPHDGWIEHDANEIWESVLRATSEALAQVDIDTRDIAAIGITNQRETLVAWDRSTGQPLCRAIVWQCRRTADYCQELRQLGLETVIRDKDRTDYRPLFFRD